MGSAQAIPWYNVPAREFPVTRWLRQRYGFILPPLARRWSGWSSGSSGRASQGWRLGPPRRRLKPRLRAPHTPWREGRACACGARLRPQPLASAGPRHARSRRSLARLRPRAGERFAERRGGAAGRDEPPGTAALRAGSIARLCEALRPGEAHRVGHGDAALLDNVPAERPGKLEQPGELFFAQMTPGRHG